MGSSILDGRPTPVAAIGRYQECRLVVACSKCGNVGRLDIARMIRRHLLPLNLPIRTIGPRLRCLTCGAGGVITGVEGWQRG